MVQILFHIKQMALRAHQWIALLLCLLVTGLGVRHVIDSISMHADHPGWDFTLRYGEVLCLSELNVDPYDIYSGTIQNERFRPYVAGFQRLGNNPLDYYWVCGYPPWEYTILLPLSLFSLRTANTVFRLFEILSIIVIFCYSLHRGSRFKDSIFLSLFVSFSLFLVPPEAWNFVFQYDNWAPLFCCGVVFLILFLEAKMDIAAGLAWGFLMIKPQQGIWFAIPLLFQHKIKTIVVAVIACIVASFLPAVLCGKSPVELIIEIPRMRLQPYYDSALFPFHVYQYLDHCLFSKAPLIAGIILSILFSCWNTWRLKKCADWFLLLQPTFFCLYAGYPPWRQDLLFYFFSILFLLELLAHTNGLPRRVRFLSFLLAVGMSNPVSWGHVDFATDYGVSFWQDPQYIRSIATWLYCLFFPLFLPSLLNKKPYKV